MDLKKIDNIIQRYEKLLVQVRTLTLEAVEAKNQNKKYLRNYVEIDCFYVYDDKLCVEISYNEPYSGSSVILLDADKIKNFR